MSLRTSKKTFTVGKSISAQLIEQIGSPPPLSSDTFEMTDLLNGVNTLLLPSIPVAARYVRVNNVRITPNVHTELVNNKTVDRSIFTDDNGCQYKTHCYTVHMTLETMVNITETNCTSELPISSIVGDKTWTRSSWSIMLVLPHHSVDTLSSEIDHLHEHAAFQHFLHNFLKKEEQPFAITKTDGASNSVENYIVTNSLVNWASLSPPIPPPDMINSDTANTGIGYKIFYGWLNYIKSLSPNTVSNIKQIDNVIQIKRIKIKQEDLLTQEQRLVSDIENLRRKSIRLVLPNK